MPIKSQSFHSKYGFKTACRRYMEILYEGLYSKCPKDLLDKLKRIPEDRKFIIIYNHESSQS